MDLSEVTERSSMASWVIKVSREGYKIRYIIFGQKSTCLKEIIVQVILFEIDSAIFYTNLHELSVHDLNKLGKFR